VADIPGLIEGAHTGAGLGIQFLRHVERTRLLVHLLDVSEASGRDPRGDFDIVQQELRKFGAGLADKPMVMVASKMDVAAPEKLQAVQELARALSMPLYPISAVTGEGVAALKYALGKKVAELRHTPATPDAAAS
ncbi:MAG: GTPase, partial [Terriglobales bacterium]